MQRYFLKSEDFMNNIIRGDDVFHISRVMRGKVGDLIEICYDNIAYIAKISSISSDSIGFDIVEEIVGKRLNKPKFTLIQGLAKGDKIDDIIKHGTELGVDTIILLQMKRSIVKIESNKLENKLTRYQKIAKEASEQAHRNNIPEVYIVSDLKEFVFNNALKLLLDEEEAKKLDGRNLKSVSLDGFDEVVFIIGPEGGIDQSERVKYISEGFIPVSIGDNILRTETASLAFLAMLNYIFMKEN